MSTAAGGPGASTAGDGPVPPGRAGFTIAHGGGLEDPGVLDALLAAAGTADGAGTCGSTGVDGAVGVAGVQTRLGREAGGVLASAVEDACDPGTGLVADLSSDGVVSYSTQQTDEREPVGTRGSVGTLVDQ